MRGLRLALAAAASLVVAAPSVAQTIRGTITGTVTDPSGAAMPGISVTATHGDTNISDTAVTNQGGNYLFPLLAPGTYTLTVEQSGFKKYLRAGIVVQIAQTTRIDIPLQVGAVTETLEVVAESPLVRSTTAELGHVIEMKQMQALPLNGRLFQSLIGLTPGAIARAMGDGAENPAAGGARGNTQHTVNGMPWPGNNFLLDGVANNEPLNALVNISPPLEAIQEFKVQTVNPTAEFGVFGGATVNLTIRSGTNVFHGSVFEYLRDDSMNQKTFFATEKEPLHSHQFGGTFGGPIVRDKAFFFVDYQRLQQDKAFFRTMSVPTARMRMGDLSEVVDSRGNPVPMYDPATAQEFVGQIIPASRINPIARRVADVWPLPNGPGIANNYSENVVDKQRLNAGDLRLDYRFSERASAFVRASVAMRTFDEGAFGNVFMGGNNSESDNFNVVGGYTRSLSADKFYELRIGYNRFDVEQHGEDFGVDKSNELGILNGNVPDHPNTSGIASFRVSGFRDMGSPGFTNSQRYGSTLHITNNLSWIRDKHTLKAGVDVRLMRSTLTNPENQPRGTFTFERLYTSRAGTAGHPFASFLLGHPTNVDRGFVDTIPKVRRNFIGVFLQDDFRVSRKLSLQLGVRWDLMTPPVDANNRQSNFSLADGLIHIASPENRGPNLNTHHDYIAPRLGFAYSPDEGKTAIRGAFGISYFPDNFGANGGTNERNYPFFQVIQLRNPGNQNTPWRSLDQGLPGFSPVTLSSTLTPPPGFAVFYIPPDFHDDTVKMFNLGVQRDIGWNTMVEATYVRTMGTNLFTGNRNLNVPLPDPVDTRPADQRRPYRSLVGNVAINQRNGDGESWYNALQLKIDKRFSGGLQALVSYTYSKTEDTLNLMHPGVEFRLPATSKTVDIPHNLAVSFTYEVPFKGNAAIEGWWITGITTYQSGDPLQITVSSSQLNTGTGNWADVTCADIGMPKKVSVTDTTANWFDTSCFAEPARYVFGNYKVGDVRGPSVFNTDLSVFKRTRFGSKTFEIRADAFNIFNKAHFSNPNTTFGNAQFGRIAGTRLPAREVQLGLRFLF